MNEKKLDPTIVSVDEIVGDRRSAFALINVIRCVLENTHRAIFREFSETKDMCIFQMDTVGAFSEYSQPMLSAKHLLLTATSINAHTHLVYSYSISRMANVDIVMLLERILDRVDVPYFERTIKTLEWAVASVCGSNKWSSYELTINGCTQLNVSSVGIDGIIDSNDDIAKVIFTILMAIGLMDRVKFTKVLDKSNIPIYVNHLWEAILFQTVNENQETVFSNLKWLEHHLDMGLKMKKVNGQKYMTTEVLGRLIDRSTGIGTNETTMFLLRYGEEHDLREKRSELRL